MADCSSCADLRAQLTAAVQEQERLKERRRKNVADALKQMKRAREAEARAEDAAAQITAREARAFRAGWATGYQERAEGLEIEWPNETDERPAAETAALERWLFVEAASKPRQETRRDEGRKEQGGETLGAQKDEPR